MKARSIVNVNLLFNFKKRRFKIKTTETIELVHTVYTVKCKSPLFKNVKRRFTLTMLSCKKKLCPWIETSMLHICRSWMELGLMRYNSEFDNYTICKHGKQTFDQPICWSQIMSASMAISTRSGYLTEGWLNHCQVIMYEVLLI